jgi:hypothetical protein
MLILKLIGLGLIAAIIAFAALLMKNISELETKIEAEKAD